MSGRTIGVGTAILGAAWAIGLAAQPDSTPADLIIHNAMIYTVNAKQPRAEAIAVRGQRIAAVGSNAEILKLKGASTRVIDGRRHDGRARAARLARPFQRPRRQPAAR